MNQEEEMLHDFARKIGEHWDNVRIFVSRDGEQPSVTQELTTGRGNWYSQYGQVELWVQRQQAYERHSYIKESDKDAND